jgi:hypothetical protein
MRRSIIPEPSGTSSDGSISNCARPYSARIRSIARRTVGDRASASSPVART